MCRWTRLRPTQAEHGFERRPRYRRLRHSKKRQECCFRTVILVHGGFADASFWTPVIQRLQANDIPVLAPANPLRGLASDAEYIASFVNQIDGPVLLVGQS